MIAQAKQMRDELKVNNISLNEGKKLDAPQQTAVFASRNIGMPVTKSMKEIDDLL